DRERFSEEITTAITAHPLITVVRDEVTSVPNASITEPVIVATGPLTSEALSADIARLVGGDHLYFYDAISPIVLADTIDRTKVFRQSRWDRSLGPVRPKPDDTDCRFEADGIDDRGVHLPPSLDAPAADDGPACGVDDSQGDYVNCPL